MGGHTVIYLKDKSQKNIDIQNARLEIGKVPQKYRFYSERDVIYQYESFKMNLGEFPKFQFPKDEINSLEDFKKFWSTEALGSVFVPPYGTLTFDCCFGRTSDGALRKMGKYVASNLDEIISVRGSFTTFVERGMTKKEIISLGDSGFIDELVELV
jgi:hypothetical protein